MSSEDVNMDEISKKRTREGDAEEQDASKRAKKDDGVSEADASSKGVKPTEAVINDDEAALYDRQIRLWGLDGQQRCVLQGGMNRKGRF